MLLVAQVRLPVHLQEGDGYLVEAAAGLIDAGDGSPEAAAIREAREELGVRVRDLRRVASVYTCPGVLTERIDCFLGRYGAADLLAGEGSGVDDDEMIDVLEWPVARLFEALDAGRLRDAKTVILAQALRLSGA